MSSDDRDLIRGAAAWASRLNRSGLDLGLSREEARRRAADLIRALRTGERPRAETPLTDADIDILYAACELLTERFAGVSPSDEIVEAPGLYDVIANMPPPGSGYEQAGLLADRISLEPSTLLEDARRLFDYVSTARWPDPDFDERAEVLGKCSLLGWRIARRLASPTITNDWHSRFIDSVLRPALRQHRDSEEALQSDAITTESHATAGSPFHPEALLPLLYTLWTRGTSTPSDVLAAARSIYTLLDGTEPRHSADTFLFEEREYFLGQTARLAGTMCRELLLRAEARHWLDLADRWFLLTENASADIARVSYQRLALRTAERDFVGVLELLPQLVATFRSLDMSEDALKCRFLEVMALKETDRLLEVKTLLREIASQAKRLRNDSLLAYAYINLVQVHGLLGDAGKAVTIANEAAPILKKLDNRIGLAKLYWGMGYLQHGQGNISMAIETFRAGQRKCAEIGMQADVAAVHLVVAELLLESGQEKQAEYEIRQALPIIDEYKLVPEGFAALSLLRESLRRQKIDRQALRDLHTHVKKDKM